MTLRFESECLFLFRLIWNWAEGFNALQNVYAEFIEWGRQLDFAIFRNADFQEFIDISEEMIACPILVYDPALKLLAYSCMYRLMTAFFRSLLQRISGSGDRKIF